MYPQLPNREEYEIIRQAFRQAFPTEALISHINKLEFTTPNSLSAFFQGMAFNDMKSNDWKISLVNRISTLEISYVFAYHYFKQGIPDEEWHRDTEAGIEYYPHVENFDTKIMFELFSDHFFYKYFSTLDNVGHILFSIHELKLEPKEQISFHTAIKKLKTKNLELFSKLNKIKYSKKFKRVSKIRNDLTHNFPHNEINSGVTIKKDGTKLEYSLKVGDYTTASKTILFMNDALDNLTEILFLDLS